MNPCIFDTSPYTESGVLFVNGTLDGVSSLYDSPTTFSFSPPNNDENEDYCLSENGDDWNHQNQTELTSELQFSEVMTSPENEDMGVPDNTFHGQLKFDTEFITEIENSEKHSELMNSTMYETDPLPIQETLPRHDPTENLSMINNLDALTRDQSHEVNSVGASTTIVYDQGTNESSSSTFMVSGYIGQEKSSLNGTSHAKKGRIRKLRRNEVIKKPIDQMDDKRKRARAIPWSTEEQKKFEESLEIYGRDWDACSEYIGTRRPQLVRSHAQKYLIKLYKLGIPLPAKVAETGKGYTLSGKPLRADSASAKSYLTRIPCPSKYVNQGEEQQRK